MKNYFIKMNFLLLLFTMIMILNSNTWFTIWIWLEVNLMIFIFMCLMENTSNEIMLKYFIIQTSSSMFLLFFSLMSNKMNNDFLSNNSYILMVMFLMLKLGAAPLHFWMKNVILNMSWKMLFMILSWQKLSILYLLTKFYLMKNFFYLFILSSAIIGSLQGLMQTMMKMIMLFSSISHVGWMLMTILLKTMIWLMYFFVYLINLYFLSILLKKFITFNEMFKYPMNKMNYLLIMILLLSMAGFPPLLGFFPKWLIVMKFYNNNMMIFLMLIMSSLLNMYMYMRMLFTYFMLNKELKLNNIIMNNINYKMQNVFILTFLMAYFMILF